jgi:hypothetical protein
LEAVRPFNERLKSLARKISREEQFIIMAAATVIKHRYNEDGKL